MSAPVVIGIETWDQYGAVSAIPSGLRGTSLPLRLRYPSYRGDVTAIYNRHSYGQREAGRADAMGSADRAHLERREGDSDRDARLAARMAR